MRPQWDMIVLMAACPSCGAERPAAALSCSRCGAQADGVPELELPSRPKVAPPTSSRSRRQREEVSFDLAFDPRPSAEAKPFVPRSHDDQTFELAEPARSQRQAPAPARDAQRAGLAEHPGPRAERAPSDAELVADYGPPPKHWLLSPFYMLRVLRRQRALRRALAARSDEATRAARDLQDALVALAERVVPLAHHHPDYADSIATLRRSEELLRVRDRVLAVENEAEMARLASADARLAKLEADLANSQAAERTLGLELQTARQALEREEANLKKAEAELRAAQREHSGTRE
jgi:hypothetical protein